MRLLLINDVDKDCLTRPLHTDRVGRSVRIQRLSAAGERDCYAAELSVGRHFKIIC